MTHALATTPADHARATSYCLALIAAHKGDAAPFVAITAELHENPAELRLPRCMAALAEMVIGTVGQMHDPASVEDHLRRALAVTLAAADQQEAARHEDDRRRDDDNANTNNESRNGRLG